MSSTDRVLPVVLLGLVAMGLTAQQPASTAPAGQSAPVGPGLGAAAALLAGNAASWRVPVHTREPDPIAGAYGWWAGGSDYKVSFHDGFVFHPRLGAGHGEGLPLHWTTERITMGGQPLAEPGDARHVRSDWRYEYRYGAVTEAYDVRADGVEQSFVLRERPPVPGELVIRGRVETALRCASVGAAHQGLTFTDGDGTPILRYGEATAIDAAGRRVAVLTSLEGATVLLTVPAAWLAEATYPVTVDPLTTPVTIVGAGNQVSFVDVAHDLESHETMIVFGRLFSGSDWDSYGYLVDNDFNGLVLVFSDLSHTYSTPYNQCCIVGGADKWAIASGRERTAGLGNIAVYVHPRAYYTANGGFTKVVAQASSSANDRVPSIGGSYDPVTGARALVAWQRDFGVANTDVSAVVGAVVDVTNASNIPDSAQFLVSPGGGDREWPCVNKCSQTGDWLVAYQVYDNTVANDDWDIRAAVVLSNGSVFQDFALTVDGTADHKILAKVEGSAGRYFYSCTVKPNDGKNTTTVGDRIAVQQFDWTGTVARRSAFTTIANSRALSLTTGTGNRGIAYDRGTVSHAAVAYETTSTQVFVHRMSLNAVSVESAQVPGFIHGASLVYNPDYLTFVTAWGTSSTPQTVFAANFDYAARCNVYGTGCDGTISCANANLPAAFAGPSRGSTQFQLRLRNAFPGGTCAAVFGFGSANLLLWGNCWLHLNTAFPLIVMPATTVPSSGAVDLPMAIPEAWMPGDLYAQWILFGPALVLRTSNAVQMQVR